MIGHANEGTPIRELADGRLLFCAGGRAYYIKDYTHGQKLEARLKLTVHLSTTAIVVALMAAAWTRVFPLQMVEIALMAGGVVIAATHFWRQRRLRQEREIVGEPRRSDNSPTVPRYARMIEDVFE